MATPESIAAVARVAFVASWWLCTQAIASPLSPTTPPPDNCVSHLSPGATGLLTWRDTVWVEHCDRIRRLWNLSSRSDLGPSPEFYDGNVEARLLPPSMGMDLPLLRVVFPERVFFDTGKSELRPEALEVVRIIARNLQLEPPDTVLFVAGHADARGGNDYNLNLSVERANAVAEAILEQGVNVAQVWRVGFGEEMPLRAGDIESAWGQNRRVEFLFAAQPEVIAAWMVTEQLSLLCQGVSEAETQTCRRQINPAPIVVRRATHRPRVDVDRPDSAIVHIPDPGQERVIVLDPINRSYSY
jgi:outer membrane protein OmpA-like peptidoglycan-associated protein